MQHGNRDELIVLFKSQLLALCAFVCVFVGGASQFLLHTVLTPAVKEDGILYCYRRTV